MSDPTRDPSPERADTAGRRSAGADDIGHDAGHDAGYGRGGAPDDTAIRPAVRDDDWLFAPEAARATRDDEQEPREEPAAQPRAGGARRRGTDSPEPSAHPVAVPLAGFFTGMVYVLVLPVLWFVLSDPDLPDDLLSVDLAYFLPAILVPLVLALVPRTRTFGRYMLLGVVLSAFVVVGVAAVVVSVLIFTGA